MHTLILPSLTSGRPVPHLPEARQLTIIGGSGAGKSRFMDELIRLNSDRAFCLSAVSAPFPEREESQKAGSIDVLYRQYALNQPYMRTDAVSELDKLVFMLFMDEFDSLLALKEKHGGNSRQLQRKPTRLDRLASLWEKVFPGNRIVRSKGGMKFATNAGDDLITADKLSQGEQTVLYYASAVLYAMPEAVIFIDSPSLFLHPTVLGNLWNSIEALRPDCTFVYNSVDVAFVGSRTRNVSVWVKNFDVAASAWDYEVIAPGELHEEIFVDLVGSRKPVLFIEGDASHSIDSRFYPLVFSDYTVKPVGSCDKVIEATRSFNDLRNLHHLASGGIVDRDRRTDHEVKYLRRKNVMVPEVAEVENLFLLEGVVRTMASRRGKNPEKVFRRVEKNILEEFRRHYEEQALQHIRHRVKREVECRIDGRFSCITAMETHLKGLVKLLDPRGKYNEIRNEFRDIISRGDYAAVLKYFNHKPMLGECGIARMLGYRHRDDYVAGVISALKENGKDASRIRKAVKDCFKVEAEG